MRTHFAAVAVLVMFAGFAGAASADELFKATLTGAQEVPPVDTETTGKAFLLLNKDETAIEIQLHVSSGVRITQSHIHCGAAGVNGPVVVFLAGNHPGGLDVDGKWVSNATIKDSSIVNAACGATVAELAASIRSGNTYVNVHSVAHASGEVRGQIVAAD
jgi:hypothetical protein